ncbi:uncharacterized protein LOC143425851 [Xylocopa sonorina]|uniref:uncharacterized protein LOC143425851 n=1 Tax=Xylocopa sonorina TaxID=1818115 RepID=UPI00403B2DE7
MPENKDKEEEKPVVAKTAIDLQRLKLQKLMKNPEKPIILPERPKPKNTPTVPEFVRNVMGSSAGAGSGEFHVYRHLRRKEYARQKFIQEKGHKELLDEEYHRKITENKRIAEEITAKKRAKRLRKKQKWKQKKRMKIKDVKEHNKNENSNSSEESSDEEETSDKNDHDLEDTFKKKVKNISDLTDPEKNNIDQNKLHSDINCSKENNSDIVSKILDSLSEPSNYPINISKNKNDDSEKICTNMNDSAS